jgi:hypothetical protein
MKALTWKAVFASLNPSPVFEVVAVWAEGLAMNGDRSRSKEIDCADDYAVPKRAANEQLRAKEDVAVPLSEILNARSDGHESQRIVPGQPLDT